MIGRDLTCRTYEAMARAVHGQRVLERRTPQTLQCTKAPTEKDLGSDAGFPLGKKAHWAKDLKAWKDSQD